MEAESPEAGGAFFCGNARRPEEADAMPTKKALAGEDLQRTAGLGA